MKKNNIYKILVLIFIIISSNIIAQKKFSELAQDYKTYFAVPDAPAFSLLNEIPSNILRPASVKEIAVSFSSFLDDESRFTLPKSFALEFSPGLLINGKSLTLSEYNNNKWLYRFRISGATSRSEEPSSTTDFAFGFRVTLNDESDLRANANYIKDATDLSEKIQSLYDEKRLILGPTAEPKMIEKLPDIIEKKNELINSFIEKWSEEKWNGNISELAFASKIASSDSLFNNVRLSKYSLWYSAAYGIGTWGQLLLGMNGNYERSDTSNEFKSSFSISSRVYIGSNKYKVHLEIQGSIIEKDKSVWLIDSGFEMRIEENIWAEFTAGIESSESFQESLIVTDFKFKYGL